MTARPSEGKLWVSPHDHSFCWPSSQEKQPMMRERSAWDAGFSRYHRKGEGGVLATMVTVSRSTLCVVLIVLILFRGSTMWGWTEKSERNWRLSWLISICVWKLSGSGFLDVRIPKITLHYIALASSKSCRKQTNNDKHITMSCGTNPILEKIVPTHPTEHNHLKIASVTLVKWPAGLTN